MKKILKFMAILTAVTTALMTVSAVFADDSKVDGDIYSPGNQNSVNVTANPGATVTVAAQIVVTWQGNKHLDAGQVVTFSVDPRQSTLPAGYTSVAAVLPTPDPWGSGKSFSGTSTVCFTSPGTAGSYRYVIKWTPDPEANPVLTGLDALTVNLTVEAPAPTTDTTPPVIAAPADITVEGNTIGGAIGVVLGSPTVSDNADPSPSVTSDAPAFFPLGITIVTWTATDASGNTASDTQTVTVVDTTPPTISAASSLTVIVGAPSSLLPAPSVADIVDPNPTVTNDAPAFFPVGVTVVTWTATDASGNAATATTTVTAVYHFGGFLAPIVTNGAGNGLFNAGSTTPVKFVLTDYSGNLVTGAAGTASINTSPSASASIRYDAIAGQYIANIKTPKGASGSFVITVTLDDGTSRGVDVRLK